MRGRMAALVAIAATVVAGGASAAHFQPPNDPHFTGAGTLTLMHVGAPAYTITCKVSIVGNTSAGVANITSVLLAGGSGGLSCANIAPAGLPWLATALGTGIAKFSSVSLVAPGPCGAWSPLPFHTSAGVWVISPTTVGACTISGKWTTHVHINAI